MSDYTKLTNFAVKDGYTTGTPAKVIKGTEIDDEFNAIATAVATKADEASPSFSGAMTTSGSMSIGTTLLVTGVTTLNSALNLNGALNISGNIVFEGATADAFETTVTVTDPTADRTITIPNKTGTVALTSDLPSNSSLVSASGTYSIAGTTTLTVTVTAHGRAVNDVVYLNFTSGTAVDGNYTITAVTTNTFTITHGTSITSSGNVSVYYSNKGLVEFISGDEAQVGTSTTKALTASAAASMMLGVGQTWTNVTSSRALSTTYTNSTGKPIQIAVGLEGSSTFSYQVIIDGNTIINTGSDLNGMALTFIIPNGSTYRIQSSDALDSWWELR